MSENEQIVREFMKGYQDGMTIAKDIAESLLAQANSEKAVLMRRIDELCEENEQLREQSARLFDKMLDLGTENTKIKEYAASTWQLFVKNGAVDESKLPEVDAVRNGLSKLGVKVD